MPKLICFDVFEADLAAGQLRKRGSKVSLRDKSFQVLASLLEHPGQVVTREELRRRLWPDDIFVDFDNNLNAAIAKLRETLGDSAEHPRFIETLPKHGYRFLPKVTEAARAPESAPKVRLVVLPFLNLSGIPEKEYFSDAMTDEIITGLARILPGQLAVIARTTAMHYKGSHDDVARIARELNVDYVVEGSVRHAYGQDGQIVVNVQLIQASEQTHLFAQRFEAAMHDIFRLHTSVAQTIVRNIPPFSQSMGIGLLRHEHLRKRPTEDLAAYNEYIKGRYEMWKLSAEGIDKAKRHFEAALDRDPRFASACNALAEMYWYSGMAGYAPSRETDHIARSYVLRALQIDDSSAETHALMSLFPSKQNNPGEIDYYNWEQIQKEVLRARELDATSRLVQIRHATVLAIHGHVEEAAAELEQVLEFDPLALDVRLWLVGMLYLGRHFDQALELLSKMVELEPDHYMPYYQLGQVYAMVRKFEDSIRAFHRALQLFPDSPVILGFLGLALGWGGHMQEAQAVLSRLHALARRGHVPATSFAWTNLGLGKLDEAFVWLDRAVEAPDRFLEPIKTFPFLDPIRSDPRFKALLRKMRLDD